MAIGVFSSTVAAEFVDVTVGHSQVLQAAGEPGTVIVGDDSIANANIVSGNTIVLTGKAIGSTNLIVLDQAGSQILSSTVQVGPVDRRPRWAVRIVKGGTNDQAYVCGPGSGCAPVSADVASVAGTFGPCMRPTDMAADGSQCGGRAAIVRPGGVDGEGQPEARP